MADTLSVTGRYLGASTTKMVGTNNDYPVRNFWLDITDRPEYPNTPEFNLRGDRVTLVDNLTKGQQIVVKFNLNGRKYDNSATGGRKGVVTNLDCWRIETVQTQSAGIPTRPTAPAPAPAPTPAARIGAAPLPAFAAAPGQEDDLPF